MEQFSNGTATEPTFGDQHLQQLGRKAGANWVLFDSLVHVGTYEEFKHKWLCRLRLRLPVNHVLYTTLLN